MTDRVGFAERWQRDCSAMLLGLLVCAVGCGQPVSVRVTDGAGYRQVLSQHSGKVVLVDFWATW